MEEQAAKHEMPVFTMAEFLETQPPGTMAKISDFRVYERGTPTARRPDLRLHCDSEPCNGMRIFFSEKPVGHVGTEEELFFFEYRCRNCLTNNKIFALTGQNTEGNTGISIKIGEFPWFGPPIPSRVISLIGPDRDAFLRGYRCENQSLGIGAFSYYRRVVENQWKRIVNEVVKVAERINAPPDTIAKLKRAAEETQFTKSVDSNKDALPSVLLMGDQNPLKLLHGALSEGLHDKTDDECLALATAVRVVLTDLADRVSMALKDEAELRNAVSRLANSNAKKTTGGGAPQ